MLTFLGLIIFVSVLVLVFMGSLAILRDHQKAENRWFGLAAFIIAIWIPANFINSSIVVSQWSNLFLAVDLIVALFVAFTLMMFMVVFSRRITPQIHTKRLLIDRLVPLCVLANIVMATLVITGNMVSTGVEDQYLKIEYKDAFYAYVLLLITYFAYALVRMQVGRKHAAVEYRAGANLIYVGFLVAITANLLTNIIFPLLVTDISLVKQLNIFGYIGIVIMVTMINIAITTKKLFDIRLIVVRALAYGLLIATLSAIYALVVFGIANHFLGAESVFAQQVVPIIAAIFLVFTAPFFKRLFDRITNKFFYQDAYDPQALLDDLNKVLIGNIELTILLRQATGVIQKHLKSQACSVVVREAGEATLRAVGTSPQHPSAQDMLVIRRGLHKLGQKIVISDDLGQHYSKLKHALTANNISVIVCLSSSYKSDEEALAYLMLGPKQSGNIYSKQDYRIIEIIADGMVIAIQNALRFEEIQGFAATLQQKVDEATAKLKRTNDKLKEMDETKDEFISMASHQLRTPLTSVKGYLSMVLEGDMGKVNPKQEKLLDQAYISSQRMVYLIADLLNVSRLKTGKFVIMSAPANLADVVQGELNQLTEVAKSKKVKVNYKKPKDFPTLMLDETKIRQVVMNFADNAIYYTPTGGHVDIEVKEDKNNIYFSVKDNGMGIPREEQKNLFTKFYRASNARKVRPDGTGLGLFMAKRVVAAQGGSILFESTEGKGSTFGFSFSKSKLALDQQKPQESADPIAS